MTTCLSTVHIHSFKITSCLFNVLLPPNVRIGTCQEEEDGAPMIILELMPYGDLKNFLITQKWVNIQCMQSVCTCVDLHSQTLSTAMVYCITRLVYAEYVCKQEHALLHLSTYVHLNHSITSFEYICSSCAHSYANRENESMVTSICDFEVYQIASGVSGPCPVHC